MISSVVPHIETNLKQSLLFLNAPITFVSARSPSTVSVRYKIPSEVGADRIVNARAAAELHSGAAIVIDFGTATTFDCLSSRHEFLGGVIAPGIVISAQALTQRTAKLPPVTLNKPARILGRNTVECIQSGLYHGYRGLVKEIVARLLEKLGNRTRVFTTGGQARWILKGTALDQKNIPHLTLMGLFFLWHDLASKRNS